MKGTILNIQKLDNFLEFFVFAIEFEDGAKGKIYKKKDEAGVEIGEEIEYTMNEKGSIKVVTDWKSSQPRATNGSSETMSKDEWAEKDRIKNLSICKQVALKCAVKFVAGYINYETHFSPEDTLKITEQFRHYLVSEDNEILSSLEFMNLAKDRNEKTILANSDVPDHKPF